MISFFVNNSNVMNKGKSTYVKKQGMIDSHDIFFEDFKLVAHKISKVNM